jgi:hypothetical protein
MQVRGIVNLASQAIRVIDAFPSQRERSRPKDDVTEGIMMSADDMRPEATLLIGLSQDAFQRQTRILYGLMCQVLRWHSIGWSPNQSMTQATYPTGEALICDKHRRPRSVDVLTIDSHGLRDV